MSNYKGVFEMGATNNPWNKVFDMVKEGSTVLDIGCSSGNFGAAIIERKRCIVDGIEPDVGDYKKAKSVLRRVANGLAEDILMTTFKKEKYDHVVFLDVIEHLYDPVATLKLVKEHLNPGGTVIFSIPNMAHVSIRLMLLKGEFEYGKTGLLDNTHLHFYTIKEIERVFAEAGYAISKLDNTEATYPPTMISDKLKDLGINEAPKLAELLNKDDARVFQYVGSAAVAKEKQKVERKEYSPDPQGEISLWYQQYLQKKDKALQQKEKDLQELREQIHEHSQSLIRYSDLLQRIQQSKSYKMGRAISAPYRLIRGRLRGSKDEK